MSKPLVSAWPFESESNQHAQKQLDKNFATLKPRPEVSLSFFSFLFSEIVQQMMRKEKEANEQRRMMDPEALQNAP